MTLTSEMSRITKDFESAQGERLTAIAKIKSEMRRDDRRNRTSLMRTMAAHRAATRNSLRNIFGVTALARGSAEDMIERFADEREEWANDLQKTLDSYVTDLRAAVGNELERLGAIRAKTVRRDGNVRRSQLKDLRRRVEALLLGSAKLIEDFNKDRARAGRVWKQHLRDATRQRREAAAETTAAGNRTRPKRKRAHL